MKYTNPPKQCDLCNKQIQNEFVDGKTQMGPWANMCQPCHTKYGVGLGTGRGQKYKKVGEDFEKVAG